jgi:1-acyl-sn-glycerol-3-phosphate acyltransferase
MTRAVIRLCAYLAVTGTMYLVWLAGAAVFWVRPIAWHRWRRFWFRSWARIVLRIFAVKLTIDGSPPDPPFILVSNHLGYLDIILYAAILDTRFVSKQDVAKWPVIGLLVRSMGTVFVDRATRKDLMRVNERIGELLDGGEAVLLFPEGTSSGGETVLAFKPSLLEVAARRAQPVHTAGITYRTEEGDPHSSDAVCWWKDMTFPGHFFGLLKLRQIHATIAFCRETVRGTDRKQLAATLRDSVEDLVRPVSRKEALCPSPPR